MSESRKLQRIRVEVRSQRNLYVTHSHTRGIGLSTWTKTSQINCSERERQSNCSAHLITVLIALKSALPPILMSFNPQVNWTFELTATSFQGASVDVFSTSSIWGTGFLPLLGGPAVPVVAAVPLGLAAVAAAAAAAAAAITAGCPLLNLIERERERERQTHRESDSLESKEEELCDRQIGEVTLIKAGRSVPIEQR